MALPDQPRVRSWSSLTSYLFVIAYSFPTTIGQGHTFRAAYYELLTSCSKRFLVVVRRINAAFALVVAFGLLSVRPCRSVGVPQSTPEHERARRRC